MSNTQFDLRDVTVTWGEHIVDGASDGDFINLKYDNDAVTEHEGGQGDVTVMVSASRKGTATISLGQGSTSNDKFSAAAALQRQRGVGLIKKPLTVTHKNGTTVGFAPEAWIRVLPEGAFGDSHKGREWVLGCAKLELFIGGSLR